MREILFRGKCDGEWVYGSLISHGDYCCILRTPETIGWHCPYLDNKMGTIDGYANPVDPDTVGEYTGLTDKNGTKIFEGDIVKPEYYAPCVVRYNGGGFHPFAIPGWEGSEDSRFVEVVGNIHDNPELLKSGLTEEGPDR